MYKCIVGRKINYIIIIFTFLFIIKLKGGKKKGEVGKKKYINNKIKS